jgi:antitoxin CcdA
MSILVRQHRRSRERRSTSLSLDRAMLDEARALGINISRAAEAGLSVAIRQERARRWQVENATPIAEYNAFIARQGIPLARFRKF